jgi:flavin-binding protein dodecin
MPPKTKAKEAASVYKIITLVGTSTESWEKAASAAVETATKTLRVQAPTTVRGEGDDTCT